jgi:hypothetical protein
MENACYTSLQNLLSSCLLYKSLRIKIHETIILPLVLYGCKTWSDTIREECRLSVLENGMLRSVFSPAREEVAEAWRNVHSDEP